MKKTNNQITDTIINDTDIRDLPHYSFNNFTWEIYEMIEQKIVEITEKEGLTYFDIKEIINNVYEYVFKEIAKEQFKFVCYSIPTLQNILFNKLSQWKKN